MTADCEDDAPDYDPKNFAPGTYGCHEALHVANMMVEMLERHLGDHPAILSNPEWKARVDRAADELASLYQEIGAAHVEKTSDPQA
jgi:23S rRNA G2445 N2-methylase RlmL